MSVVSPLTSRENSGYAWGAAGDGCMMRPSTSPNAQVSRPQIRFICALKPRAILSHHVGTNRSGVDSGGHPWSRLPPVVLLLVLRPLVGSRRGVWVALVTPVLTQRGLLNGDSESFRVIFRGPLVNPGVTTGPQSLSLETGNGRPAPRTGETICDVGIMGKPRALSLSGFSANRKDAHSTRFLVGSRNVTVFGTIARPPRKSNGRPASLTRTRCLGAARSCLSPLGAGKGA
jgi:hypothetical protein